MKHPLMICRRGKLDELKNRRVMYIMVDGKTVGTVDLDNSCSPITLSTHSTLKIPLGTSFTINGELNLGTRTVSLLGGSI